MAISTPFGGAGVAQAKEFMGAAETTSATLVPVVELADPANKLEISVTLSGPGRIMASCDFSSESTGGGVNAVGGWALQINSVNGTEFTRFLSGTNDRMMGGARMLSSVLGAGTYLVKAMHRRVSGSKTLRTDTAVMFAEVRAPA